MDVHNLRRRRVTAFRVGELVGFLPPAITGATLAPAGAPAPVLIVGLTAADAIGAPVLGAAQARVLHHEVPT